MRSADASRWATMIDDARLRGDLLDELITDRVPLSLEDAYDIQAELTALRLRRGERQIGWKLGYTSAAMRAQMGVTEANVGPLTDAMVLVDGADIADVLAQPMVEPEIGVIVARPLPARPTAVDVGESIGGTFACLEVVDSVWRAYRFRIEDNTADGSSAARVVVGPQLDPRQSLTKTAAVILELNGSVVATASSAAALGAPIEATAWLARWLADRGRPLEPGSIVITGGLTAAVPLRIHDVVSATFASGRTGVSVTVRRTGR